MRQRPVCVAAGAVLAAIMVISVADVEAAGIKWRPSSLGEALKSARAEGSVVMVDVYADWCGPCHRLDEEVFNRDDVAGALKGAIPLKIDGEKGEGPRLVERYHVVGYPTILFLNSKGEEIDRVFGFMDAEAFKNVAANFISGKLTLAHLRAELEKKPKDDELRYEVGKRLVIRGELDEALPILKPIFGDDEGNEAGYVPAIHHLLGKYAYMRGKKDYKKAIEHLKAIVDGFPQSPEAASAPYDLAKAYHGLGDPDRTMATFDAWIEADPKEGAGRHNAVAWFCFQKDFELDKAVAVARRGLARDPGAAFLWDTLAEIHFKRGDKKAAVEAIKKAIEVDPKDKYYQDQLKKFAK